LHTGARPSDRVAIQIGESDDGITESSLNEATSDRDIALNFLFRCGLAANQVLKVRDDGLPRLTANVTEFEC